MGVLTRKWIKLNLTSRLGSSQLAPALLFLPQRRGFFSASFRATLLSMEIEPIDLVRAILANASVEDMTVDDVLKCAEHAKDLWALDDAVNELAQTQPGGANVFIMKMDDLRNLFG